MYNPTLLVIISIVIVLFLFVGAYIIHNINNKKDLETRTKQDNQLKDLQDKQREEYFSQTLKEFFDKHSKEYNKIDVNTKVSELNKMYKDELNGIIKSPQIQSILSNVNSRYHKEASFLKEINKESAFTWDKKFGKKIGEYYG